jgi:hypothetical protein
MPFREMSWPETELAAGDAVTGDETATLQMLDVPTDGGGKLKVAYVVIQGAPDVIDIHQLLSARDPIAVARSGQIGRQSRESPSPSSHERQRGKKLERQ